MADDLSLLFRLKADNTQAKAVIADTRASVAQLRQSFGPQLSQTVTVTNKAFSDLGANLNNFVAQRVPLVGGAIVRVTEGLKGFSSEGAKTEKAIAGVAKSIESIATQSGKTVPAIASFLTRFIQLEGQAKRDKAAVDFFGASLGTKLIPELEKTGTALAGVAGQSATAGASIAGMAGPIGIVVIALAAMAAGAVIAGREIFQLTKHAAEFQGRMFDLAQQTGLAVETLSALEVVAKTTGGSIDTIAQAIIQFQRKLDDAQDPLSKTAEQFRKFNVDTSDTETALRSAFTALARMPQGFAQTNAAAEFFGARGGKQVLAILKETGGSIDETIKKLSDLGILISEDSARAADKFNDELALLEFQLRALGAVAAEELIPALTEVIRSLGDLVRASRPLISIFGTVTSSAIKPAADALKGLSLIVLTLTKDYEGLERAIKEAGEASTIAPIALTGVSPVPLPGAPTARQAATEAANQADAVVAAVKRTVAESNQALDELFQKGRRGRQQQAEETIAGNQRVLDAEQQRIDAQLTLREQEIKALDEAQEKRGQVVSRDADDYRAITKEIEKLQQERLDKENEFEVSSRAIRAKAAKERADSTRNQLANERDLLVAEFDRTIKDVEAQIARGETAQEAGLTTIEQIEQAKIEARLESLQKQRDVGFLTVQDQKDLDAELQKLNQERDQLEDEQRNRRLDRERAAGQRARDILISNIDTLLQVEQIAGERRIDVLQALAERRVITEEEAARQILKTRLDLIDDEIEATQAKLSAASSITDNDERIRATADLNNQLRILTEERITIVTSGEREIDESRRRDIDNERRYADELRDIRERVRRIERDAAEEIIRLMVINFTASRRDIIRARLQADIEDENARHRQAEETIRNLEDENRESNRTAEEKLEAEREINQLREAEAERHRLALQGIKDQARRDEQEASPLGRLGFDVEGVEEFASLIADAFTSPIEALRDAFRELQDAAREFVVETEDSIVPLGEILRGTFSQVADAIGQTVANWVLLGETGPAVMRKILAQALASLAAEAAVNAIKELALGFATLFFNPAESAAHFTAAGLWAAIGGVAAVAGRGVAGDLFKSRSAGAGGGSSDGRSGELNPLNLQRNAGPLAPGQQAPIIRPNFTINIVPDGTKFAQAVDAHVVDDFNNAGPIRQVISGDGNLNRG